MAEKTDIPERKRGRPLLGDRPLTPKQKSARYHAKKKQQEGLRALMTYVQPETVDILNEDRSEGETTGEVIDRWAADRRKI
jgi:hypothetical protein